MKLSDINDAKLRKRIEQADREQNRSGNNRPTNPRVQEQQKVNSGLTNRIAKNPDAKKDEVADGLPRKRYAVRIVFRVSDNRKRDAFGMLETVADCLVRAVRRFNQGDSPR